MPRQVAYKSPEPEPGYTYIPAPLEGRATGQGASTGRSSHQSAMDAREEAEGKAETWLKHFDDLNADEMASELALMNALKTKLDNVVKTAGRKLEATNKRTMVPFELQICASTLY